MKVLVACEFSGVVRRAFRARGHDAFSCDLLPAEDGSPKHFQADILTVLDLYEPIWDLMIAHPPCTYLCNSGVRWLFGGKGTDRDQERWSKMEDAAKFFRTLLDARIPKIAVENPIMHSYGRELVGRRHDQLVQPWQFKHEETKATCFWLKNLPPLIPTGIVDLRFPRVHHAPPPS